MQRVVRIWNELAGETVEAITKAMFKRYLDRYIDRQGLEGHGAKCRKMAPTKQ